MSIPVFIHHEINCGNVRGMGSSDYPLYALQSAKKYNERRGISVNGDLLFQNGGWDWTGERQPSAHRV